MENERKDSKNAKQYRKVETRERECEEAAANSKVKGQISN